MSYLRVGVYISASLLLIGFLFGEYSKSYAYRSDELLYYLEATDENEQVIESGTMRIDFRLRALTYQINDTEYTGRIKFKEYREGIAKAVLEFLISSMAERQIRLLSTVFLPIRFEIDRIERKVGAGWYVEDAMIGFGFVDKVSIGDKGGIEGKFIYGGREAVRATYLTCMDHPVRIFWTDVEQVSYKAVLDRYR